VWPESVVEENALAVQISRLRSVFGETARDARFIQTVPRTGYRFVAPVVRLDAAETLAPDEDTAAAVPVNALSDAVAADSRRLILAAVALVGLALLLLFASRALDGRPGPAGEVTTIAVLPLQAVGDLPVEHLGTGLADALVTQFGTLERLVVRPVSAVLDYDGGDPLAAGRALRVDAVLEGSLQHIGDRLRVTLRLLDTATGGVRWSGSFAADAQDLLSVQDELAERVVDALALDLAPAEQRQLRTRRAQTAAAHDAYLRGRALVTRRTGADIGRALAEFRTAVQEDPRFSLAYAAMASSYVLLVWYEGIAPREAMPRARAAAEAARAIDPGLPEALIPLAQVAWLYDGDIEFAERAFREAASRGPNLAAAHHHLGEFLALTGRFDEGITHLERARTLDPLSPGIAVDAASAYYLSGDRREAERRYRDVLALYPGFPLANLFLGMLLDAEGRADESLQALEAAVASGGRAPLWLAQIAIVLARSERTAAARDLLAELEALADQRFVSQVALAGVYDALGDRDTAFALLADAAEQRDPMWIYVDLEPRLADLRADARFERARLALGHRR
jgi:TolB-like protein/Flp pilus assembly protein TadD